MVMAKNTTETEGRQDYNPGAHWRNGQSPQEISELPSVTVFPFLCTDHIITWLTFDDVTTN